MKAKVSVIGSGHVGATTAQLILQAGLGDIVLYDIAEGVPQGKALDLSQAASLWDVSASCAGTGNLKDTSGSDIIVVTAGLPRKPGMSRDDLLFANADVIRTVVQGTAQLSPDAVFIIVTNPMDVMTQIAWKVSGFDHDKVVGMGGVLDSARFRTFVAMELNVSPGDVETLVMGGHGDLMVPLPGFTTVKGMPLAHFLDEQTVGRLIERTRNGGAEIVSLLKSGSAYYAPAASVVQMVRAVLRDERRILPCSAYLQGEYGIEGVFVGVPVILGRNGVEKIIELRLGEKEMNEFKKSASAVKGAFEKVLSRQN